MVYLGVAVGLLLAGGVAGFVGTRLGTAIAVFVSLVWLGVLIWFGLAGAIESEVELLAACLVIGLLAFLSGSSIASRVKQSRKPR